MQLYIYKMFVFNYIRAAAIFLYRIFRPLQSCVCIFTYTPNAGQKTFKIRMVVLVCLCAQTFFAWKNITLFFQRNVGAQLLLGNWNSLECSFLKARYPVKSEKNEHKKVILWYKVGNVSSIF